MIVLNQRHRAGVEVRGEAELRPSLHEQQLHGFIDLPFHSAYHSSFP